jgi:hypothetical protein
VVSTPTSSTRPRRASLARLARRAALAALLLGLVPGTAKAQLGTLASPGPLSKAHANLEGISRCQSCHEPGRQVTAARCLACHKPIAQRITQKKGVHREVTNECATCHVEHNGRDAELRPLDAKGFDHKAQTGFALDGRHVGVACAKCHTTRSFLSAKPECASCHADPHKGTLGPSCASCHATSVPFKQASQRFDHTKAAFQLTGGHQQVACARCHVAGKFKGLEFSSCASCHTDPHAKKLGNDCTTCHTTAQWKTARIDHARTAFPLRGKHEAVACVKCHVQSPVKVRLKFTACADCHKDPHAGRFKETCETCHKETGFRGAPFDHKARTTFELTGKHARVECSKCHKGVGPTPSGTARAAVRTVDFGGLKTECQSCHADPHKGELGTACSTCHGTDSFRLTTYTHPRMPEFFAGEHAKATCVACHGRESKPAADGTVPVSAMRFKNVPTTCTTCHKDVHLGQLGVACEACHRIDAPKFAAPGFSHERSSFTLTGRHQQVECAKCHVSATGAFPAGTGEARKFKGVATDCASCHKDVHLGQLSRKCETCHTTDGFAVRKYEHTNLRGFFVGGHQNLECIKCHKREDGVFPAGRGVAVRFTTGRECSSCHKDAHAGSMGTECSSCHTPDLWRSPNRAFHKTTQFPLTGRHLAVACESCHLQGQLKGTPNRCYDCHWIRRQDDRYETRLGNECEDCHQTTSWAAVRWDHGSRTGTPLNIAHRLLACDSCHTKGVFEGRRPECIACHERDYRTTRSPDHAAAGFPFECQMCHAAAAPTFAGGRFAHASYTLRGVHATQTCGSCHRNGLYQGTPRDCVSCHRDDYEATSRPGHAAAGFPTNCDQCHREGGPSWSSGSASFNHSQFYPLSGAHQTASCTSCHANGIYKGTPRDCYSCHQEDFRQTRSPNHVSGGFSTACETCHRAGGPGWVSTNFRHTSAFPLNGTHASVSCADCHGDGVYNGRSSECSSCHLADYQRTTDPNHAAAGFPTTCQTCHRSGGPDWGSGSFNHNSFFQLSGTHATSDCASCHENGVYKGTPRECYACHQSAYQRTSNPNHASAGFPTTCQTCHRSGGPGWGSGSFNHNSFYQLSGRHQTAECASCHVNNVYKGTPRDCYSCHRTNYQRTTNPSHVSAGYPTACEQCHRAGGPGWSGATTSHTSFPLSGLHQSAQCSACHTNGRYAGTSRLCFTCHQTSYQRTTNPNHVAAGFPTTCETCHRSGGPGWNGASFSHSQFFSLVGRHAGAACADCHRNNVYAGTPRTCVGCHQADYNGTRDPNHASAGFPTTCDTCHRATDTSWGQGTFNHTWFPIASGRHSGHPCSACHQQSGNFQSFTCLTCHTRAETDDEHRGRAGYRYESAACYSCHPNGRSD